MEVYFWGGFRSQLCMFRVVAGLLPLRDEFRHQLLAFLGILLNRRQSEVILRKWFRLVALSQAQRIDSPRLLALPAGHPGLRLILIDRWSYQSRLRLHIIDSQIAESLVLHVTEAPAALVLRFLDIRNTTSSRTSAFGAH